eukprot:GHVR01157072.1.p1 GENE.GHVR01157072.1~~GHVR01157072.1.p1  ORF type:complete len:651 (-),score=113.23 GHVR01157072.1:149-2101(-)
MYVVKRNGEREEVVFDKITKRIHMLCYQLSNFVDARNVAQRVIQGLYSGITTVQLDELAAQTCGYMAATHPDYSKLAARIAVSNLHKLTSDSFINVIHTLYHYTDKQGRNASLISTECYEFVNKYSEILEKTIDYSRDYEYDFFGFKTLERSYLLKVHGKITERPQHMLMRVACGIHIGCIADAVKTYNLLSQKYFTHATPTLFNAGTAKPQMSSCFLITMKDDSIDGIFHTLRQCALISKYAGGIGVAIHKIRASESYIRGTNGKSNGIVPMLRVFNDTARYVDQGGGKRKGSFAMYLEPWHADVFEFLDLKKNHGKEEHRARDLFFGLWIPDLFMRRVERDGQWTLMCPNECPGLYNTWGSDFDTLYEKYESEGKGRKTVKAQALWFKILESQIETGTPYMLYKDACNSKSNQMNLGTIQCSNLCTEIVQYSSSEEAAVCNLASLALPRYVNTITHEFDYDKLHEVVQVATRNLNKIIDRNYYPIAEAELSNKKHRPLGLGVQGFADALMLLRHPFESPHAFTVNRDVFETIYHGALTASHQLAVEEGPYETFEGSPLSKGIFQFDMWGVKPTSGRWDWETLRTNIKRDGVRNSLLVAPMPTASTSQILGNNESIEAFTSNIYYRRVLSGILFYFIVYYFYYIKIYLL